MKVRRLDEMVGGWIVGAFEPACLRTDACEVACKRYAAGEREAAHVHRIATEMTLIAVGRARMNDRILDAGDIAILAPGEPADFETLQPTVTVVVKMPSVPGDKYRVGGTRDGASGGGAA